MLRNWWCLLSGSNMLLPDILVFFIVTKNCLMVMCKRPWLLVSPSLSRLWNSWYTTVLDLSRSWPSCDTSLCRWVPSSSLFGDTMNWQRAFAHLTNINDLIMWRWMGWFSAWWKLMHSRGEGESSQQALSRNSGKGTLPVQVVLTGPISWYSFS